jgi:hypothetical protein
MGPMPCDHSPESEDAPTLDPDERLTRPELWSEKHYESIKRWVNEVVDTMADTDSDELRAILLGLRETALESIRLYEVMHP